MTTLVVTHDMNSVMGIGEYVMFLYHGQKEWEGDSKSILKSDNQALKEFVFASKIMEGLL
jgi:phospholipid/cholesterol/gamma-HCH transport system ATP-binding protein